jgi:hypothetical protein
MSPFYESGDLPIATEDVVVHDDALGINRKIIAGTQVPPDLIDAYEKATAPKSSKKASDAEK